VGGKRRKWDVRSHKKSDKWDVQSQKLKGTQIREMMKILCTTYSNKKMASKKKGKNERKKKDVRSS